MRILIAFLSLFAIAVHAGTSSDSELQRLTFALDQAKAQTDMNLASKNICEFWDAKLILAEKRIDQKLGGREKKRFSESKNHWRLYRAREVAFRAGVFEGGSVQPLVANSAYSQITEHRVTELETLFIDALAPRKF